MQTSLLKQIMDETDSYSRTHSERLSHAQVFDHARDVVIAELNQADAICENDPRHYTRAQSLKLLKERRDVRRVNADDQGHGNSPLCM